MDKKAQQFKDQVQKEPSNYRQNQSPKKSPLEQAHQNEGENKSDKAVDQKHESEQEQLIEVPMIKHETNLSMAEQAKKILEQIKQQKQENKRKQIALWESKKKPKGQINQRKIRQKQKNEEEELRQKEIKAKNEKIQKLEKESAIFVQKYRKSLTVSRNDSEIARFRFEQKERVFKSLIIGVLQLRQENRETLTEDQIKIQELASQDAYILARKLCMDIDSSICNFILSKRPHQNFKNLRIFYKQFNANLRDDQNLALRKKILTNLIPPEIIPQNEQSFFYSEQKAIRIQKMNQKLLSDAEVRPQGFYLVKECRLAEEQPSEYKPEQKIIKYETLPQSTQLTKNFYSKNSLDFLQTLLSEKKPSILAKNLQMIENPLQKDIFAKHLEKTFEDEQNFDEKLVEK